MGVPVVAMLGRSASSRIGGSILKAIGLDDWIADDDDGYVAIAKKYAPMASELSALRAGLPARIGKLRRGQCGDLHKPGRGRLPAILAGLLRLGFRAARRGPDRVTGPLLASGSTPSAFHVFASAKHPPSGRMRRVLSGRCQFKLAVLSSTGSEAPEVRNFTLVCQVEAQLETTDAGRSFQPRRPRPVPRQIRSRPRVSRHTPFIRCWCLFLSSVSFGYVVDGSGLLEDGRNDVG